MTRVRDRRGFLRKPRTHASSRPAPAVCVCGCPEEAHEHYRPGSDCGACGSECRRYRPRYPR